MVSRTMLCLSVSFAIGAGIWVGAAFAGQNGGKGDDGELTPEEILLLQTYLNQIRSRQVPPPPPPPPPQENAPTPPPPSVEVGVEGPQGPPP